VRGVVDQIVDALDEDPFAVTAPVSQVVGRPHRDSRRVQRFRERLVGPDVLTEAMEEHDERRRIVRFPMVVVDLPDTPGELSHWRSPILARDRNRELSIGQRRGGHHVRALVVRGGAGALSNGARR
jgi:hypothetical protein